MSPIFSRGGNARPFVILFPGRTGSSWLVDALGRHPRIHAEGEILVRRSPEEQPSIWSGVWNRGSSRRAAGFKTKLKDVVDPAALASAIEEAGVVVVHMRRGDLLRLALSRMNARRLHAETGHWNVRSKADRVAPGPVDREELVEAMEACRQDVEELDRFTAGIGSPIRIVRYAEILQDADGVLERVQDWLGVPCRNLSPGVMKNSREDLREAIPGFDELRRSFAGSRWESAFDVDPVKERPDDSGR